MDGFLEVVKRYPGQQQVDRHVKVQVPGKHFPALTTAEKRVFYSGEAAEYRERHDFPRHLQAWGEKHTGPGIRFLCPSDVIDDPDHKGFWTTLGLWNKWRHSTYVNDREAEKQYLDELPAVGRRHASRGERVPDRSRRQRGGGEVQLAALQDARQGACPSNCPCPPLSPSL